MKAKAEYILQIFEKNQYRHLKNSTLYSKAEKIKSSEYYKCLKESYLLLGGIQEEVPLFDSVFDLEFEKFSVIVDEELSFNRYRALTLNNLFYSSNLIFNLENYKRYCRQFEIECLKSGRSLNLWSDKLSEFHFGESESPGDLALKGAPKWKLRAFSDLLVDVSSIFNKQNFIRISIYDNLMINNRIIKLNDLLISRNPINEKYIWNYLQRRIVNFADPEPKIPTIP